MARYDEMMFTAAVEARQDGIASKGKFASRYSQVERQKIGPDSIAFLLNQSTMFSILNCKILQKKRNSKAH